MDERTRRGDRRAALRAAVAAGVAAVLPALARAQATWPSRPVRFVVPFAPGGSSEIVARSTAAELTKLLGQSVYVENKPGGAGNVAMAEVAAATDQHTLVLGHIGTKTRQRLILGERNQPSAMVRDFFWISRLHWSRLSITSTRYLMGDEPDWEPARLLSCSMACSTHCRTLD